MKDHILELRRKISAFFIIYRHITNLQSLIAQLLEHCIGIAEVMGWTPIQACFFFFQALISQLLNLCV